MLLKQVLMLYHLKTRRSASTISLKVIITVLNLCKYLSYICRKLHEKGLITKGHKVAHTHFKSALNFSQYTSNEVIQVF